MRILALSLLIMVWAGPSLADSVSGNDFHADCQGPKSFGWAYVAGVTDKAAIDAAFAKDIPAAERTPKVRDLILVARPYCVPESVTITQAMDVVCKYLREKPETRHFGASSIVQNALREAFPCK